MSIRVGMGWMWGRGSFTHSLIVRRRERERLCQFAGVYTKRLTDSSHFCVSRRSTEPVKVRRKRINTSERGFGEDKCRSDGSAQCRKFILFLHHSHPTIPNLREECTGGRVTPEVMHTYKNK